MKQMASRKVLIIVGIVLALLIIGFGAAAYAPGADERDTGAKKDNSANNEPAKTVKRYEGELVCLPHKGNPEVTTLECASGFKDTEGMFYGLRDDEHKLADYLTKPTGTKVVIMGSFAAGADKVYESIGTITVSSVETQE